MMSPGRTDEDNDHEVVIATPNSAGTPTTTADERSSHGHRSTPTSSRTARKASTTSSQQRRMQQYATHRIVTRSMKKSFRLLDLPAELRTRVYTLLFATATDEVPLNKIVLPPICSVSRETRTDALPIFFAETKFSTTLRCNYCIFAGHYHKKDIHKHYHSAGKVLLPKMVRTMGESNLAVRIRHLQIRIDCICCSPGKEIGSLALHAHGRNVTTILTVTAKQPEVKVVLENMQRQVNTHASSLAKVDGFNGFKVPDMKGIALCFRVDDIPAR